jgi:flavodoxin
MNKTLISYFSASGVTKNVAKKISEAISADIFEIEPVNKYTDEDLDWTNKESRTTIEMNDKSSRPQIKNRINNIEEYDRVIIGFPVWWYTAPTIINTFLEENDLTNKKVYIFVTSGSSSYGGCLKDLRNTYPNINFVDGKRFTADESLDNIKNWLK